MKIGQLWQIANFTPHFHIIDGPPKHSNRPNGRFDQPRNDLDNRAFASSVGTEKAEGFATVHDKAYVIHRDEMVIDLAQIFHFDGRRFLLHVSHAPHSLTSRLHVSTMDVTMKISA